MTSRGSLWMLIACFTALLAALLAPAGEALAQSAGPLPLVDRPPGAAGGDGGPSAVIFPAQTLPIKFNHAAHVGDIGLECADCHTLARTSRSSKDRLLPLPTRCDGCHGSDHKDLDRVTSPPNSKLGNCAFCHDGYRPSDGNRVQRVVMPAPNLKFDHAAHVSRNIQCPQCHGSVGKTKVATRDQMPRMRGCFRCHQMPAPARGTARGDCTTCHLGDGGGRIKTTYTSGRLVPPRWLHDSGHGPDWIVRHRTVAGADSRFCGTCHRQDECVECHDGKVRPRSIHPNDWLELHPIAARRDNRCTTCHQEQSFCVTCHKRLGLGPRAPYGTRRSAARFHPDQAVWSGPIPGPLHHAWEAQRNLSACVSCHTERDCVGCHATTAMGGKGSGALNPSPIVRPVPQSPHPPGFASMCRGALHANPRPCLVCHAPFDSELARCR